MERKYDKWSRNRFLFIGGSILIWAAVLIALLILMGVNEEPEPEPIFGSLEGRFESDVTMTLNDRLLHYRENEITNYLIIGVDTDEVTQVTSFQHGGQADFLMVLSIDRVNRSVTPVMLDRDAMVEMQTYGVFGHPAGTTVMQLCLAQAYSGAGISGSDNTARTVEKLLQGITIHHHVVMDMKAIPLLNDAIGGVEVTLKDDFTIFDPIMTKGATIRLMGDQAEFFVRGRMTVADGTNASRMGRQQQYLSGLLSQFRKSVKGNQAKLVSLLQTLDGHMISDASQRTLLQDVNFYDDYVWTPMRTLEGEHTIDAYGFAEFWVDEAALKTLVADIWFK